MRGRRDDLTGQVFGNLTVLGHRRRNLQRDLVWLCVCTCGARVWKTAHNLKQGMVKSCGNQHRWNSAPAA